MITSIIGLVRARSCARARIEAQGFTGLDDDTVKRIDPWLRVAPALCLAWTAVGTAVESPLLLWLLASVALVGVLDRSHPFDGVYNHFVRHRRQAPRLPDHRAPRRFAWAVAAALATAAGYGFASGDGAIGWTFGAVLATGAAIMVTTGFCIPAYLWTLLRRRTGPALLSAGARLQPQ